MEKRPGRSKPEESRQAWLGGRPAKEAQVNECTVEYSPEVPGRTVLGTVTGKEQKEPGRVVAATLISLTWALGKGA